MNKHILKLVLALFLAGFGYGFSANVIAAPDCSGDALISETFANGAKWEMCWNSRIRENLVLTDVYYSPPKGSAVRVLGSARLSQLHVAYDDSNVTYNDVTQYGLGGGYLVELTENDCPYGDILNVQTRPALCRWRSTGNDNYRTPSRSVSAESLTLFSVSQVGAYAYIVTWKFYSDGAIEPQIGATGALQRSSEETELPFGRLLQGDNDTLWLSHTHNYYWRLDFDLGEFANDDVVTESTTTLLSSGQRQTAVERFTTEQARLIDPAKAVAWEIWASLESELPGPDDAGYRIEPVHSGHRLQRPDIEPYTQHDFFVTVVNDCERFASQNARFNPDCLNHVAQFVDDESLVDADLTIWNRVSFHHVPRNEDQRNMHTHWDGFTIEPVNMHRSTPGINLASNSAPELNVLSDRTDVVGTRIDWQLSATDKDSDPISYSASSLPDGLAIDNTGRLSGTVSRIGTYNVSVFASDDIDSASRSFTWQINDGGQATSQSSGGFGSIQYWLLLLITCVKLLRFYSMQRPRH